MDYGSIMFTVLGLSIVDDVRSGPAQGADSDQFLGCFVDYSFNRDMIIKSSFDNMTIDQCIMTCRTQNSTFAGLQDSAECYCGESYGRYGLSNNCNLQCSGDSTQICGGYLANSVYSVCPAGRYGRLCDKECFCSNGFHCVLLSGVCNSKLCQPGWIGNTCSTLSPNSGQYVGCYKDDNDDHALNELERTYSSIAVCVQRCRDYGSPFAGAQYGSECFCGVTYDKHGIGREGCSTKQTTHCCSSDNTGGANANSVYRVVCPAGFYGAKCVQRCHCSGNSGCSFIDGSCSGRCEHGWTGPACNVSDNTDCQRDCSDDETCMSLDVGWTTVKRCVCKTGYYLTQNLQCKDVDECDLGLCRENAASCNNTDGGFDCACNDGYRHKHGYCIECSHGEFGRNCLGKCRCSNALDCHPANGTCLNGGVCETDWSGPDCQVPFLSEVRSQGGYAGVAVGICLILLVIIIIIVYIVRKRRNKIDTKLQEPEHSDGLNQHVLERKVLEEDGYQSLKQRTIVATSDYEKIKLEVPDGNAIYSNSDTNQSDVQSIYYNTTGPDTTHASDKQHEKHNMAKEDSVYYNTTKNDNN